jgi:hypothetical protein
MVKMINMVGMINRNLSRVMPEFHSRVALTADLKKRLHEVEIKAAGLKFQLDAARRAPKANAMV